MTNPRRSPIVRTATLALALLTVPLALGISATGCGSSSSGKVNDALTLSPLTGTTLPSNAAQHRFFTQRISVVNPGSDVFRFAESGAGDLPAGLFVASTDGNGKAVTTGTFTDVIGFSQQSGLDTLTFQVFQQNNNSTQPRYELTTIPSATGFGLSIAPASGTLLTNGTVAAVYTSNTITLGGGTAPYAFRLVFGALPPGLTFTENPTGTNSAEAVIGGTPTSVGTWIFAYEGSDSGNPGIFTGGVFQITIQ